MEILFIIFIYILGTVFGSFSSVVISRVRKKEKGIFMGRSHCTSCNNILQARDLVPIFSYVFGKGKCRFCGAKISAIYPILEIVMGTVFALGAYFFVDFNSLLMGNNIEFFKLFFILYISFFSIIYVFYDILYLEIPDTIMTLLNFPLFIILSLQTAFGWYLLPFYRITPELTGQTQIVSIIASFIILLGLYIVMTKQIKSSEKLDSAKDFGIIIISYVILYFLHYFGFDLSEIPILAGISSVLVIFTFFFLQIFLSNYKALGGGDLRIGIFMGLLLGLNYSLFGVMSSYMFGSIIGLIIIFVQHIKQLNSTKKIINSVIPFGPFLAMGTLFVVYFYKDLSKVFYSLILF